ncbi:MAG TPA: hypothetical protein VGB30_01130 [bacterium]|jgi:hypothetical protein
MTDICTRYPVAYLITIRCYGTFLPGQEGRVDRIKFNSYGTGNLPAHSGLEKYSNATLTQPPYYMDEARRKIILDTIISVSKYRKWILHAAHVRSNQFHAIIGGNVKPEFIVKDLKSYGSRHLNLAGLDCKDRKRWARHGSTKYLWNMESVADTIDYVIRRQGAMMELYEGSAHTA